jgi:hypothetical protein
MGVLAIGTAASQRFRPAPYERVRIRFEAILQFLLGYRANKSERDKGTHAQIITALVRRSKVGCTT